MFRILNNYWVELQPQLTNYKQYNGSNKEEENFHGGKSVVFAVSEDCLDHKTTNINVKVRVFKEISKHFEIETCYDAGETYIDIHPLFNGIVKERTERKRMGKNFTHFHEREPISRSLKSTFEILNGRDPDKSGTIDAYVRLSYFGKSIITEFDRFPADKFHVSEEMCEGYPYQYSELSRDELENGLWGGSSIDLPLNQRGVICGCEEFKHNGKENLMEQCEITVKQDSNVEMKDGVDRSKRLGSGDLKKLGKDGIHIMDDMSCDVLKKLKDGEERLENGIGKSDGKLKDNDIDQDAFDDRRGQKGLSQINYELDGDDPIEKRPRKKRDRGLRDDRFEGDDFDNERSRKARGNRDDERLKKRRSRRDDQFAGDKSEHKRQENHAFGGVVEFSSKDLEGGSQIKKYRKKMGKSENEWGGREVRYKKERDLIGDTGRREYLKGTATGTVTIGLSESRTKGKCSKMPSRVLQCPVKSLIASRCYCLPYSISHCYNYQYC